MIYEREEEKRWQRKVESGMGERKKDDGLEQQEKEIVEGKGRQGLGKEEE